MEKKYYSIERNVQIVIALLKEYGIRRIIASPGTTNLTFVASLQQDSFFTVYSAPEERSAAYMAVGMAEESGEPVVITCTGATASRNYMPGMTEAFYRKLPVIAITATQTRSSVGQLVPQVIDRSILPNDVAVFSAHIPTVNSKEDERMSVIKVNEAFHCLKKNGGGPVHLNLETTYNMDFTVKELPPVRKIDFYDSSSELPEIKGKVGIFVGSHSKFTDSLTDAVDSFCEAWDSVVVCDHTSNYKGRFRLENELALSQDNWKKSVCSFNTLIYIGEVSGSYTHPSGGVWRVNPDGMIRDPFWDTKAVFQMEEETFFLYYAGKGTRQSSALYQACKKEQEDFLSEIPELPFSNIWIAQQWASKLPENSVLHLGILNSLRAWNFFEIPNSVNSYCNVGGFGIDGPLSTVIGGALAQPEKIHFMIVGDLAFFYDMNSLGNRHLPANLRILLVNNGRGTEFRNYNHPGFKFGEKADDYIAAAGHYGHQSPDLIRHYAEDLGFEYRSVNDKEELLANTEWFLTEGFSDKPFILEVFTETEKENEALYTMRHLRSDSGTVLEHGVRKMLGKKGISVVKKVLKK